MNDRASRVLNDAFWPAVIGSIIGVGYPYGPLIGAVGQRYSSPPSTLSSGSLNRG